MNWDHIKADWMQAKGKIKSKWAKLTDDDLKLIDGKWDQLVGKLQHHYGYAKDDAEKQVDGFLAKLDTRNKKEGNGKPVDHSPR